MVTRLRTQSRTFQSSQSYKPFSNQELDVLLEYRLKHLIAALKDQEADVKAIFFVYGIWRSAKNADWHPTPGQTTYVRYLIAYYLEFGPSDVLEA